MKWQFNLETFGWQPFFERHFQQYKEKHFHPARVIAEHKGVYRLVIESSEVIAELSGKLRHQAVSRFDLPAVGDWVAVRLIETEQKALIQAVLPRLSRFVRKAAGARTEEQVVAANIDTVFLVSSLNNDFNTRRLERYLTVAWESGARPVIVLSKADLCDNVEERIEEVREIAFSVLVHAVSAFDSFGMDQLKQYFASGKTLALLGSSGVGKSTLINYLLGFERQATLDARESDERGRHATTRRELILLSNGAMVIDTPGMRELQLWDASEGLRTAFDDIETLAQSCRFRDCHHKDEPGCAVKAAVENGDVDQLRFGNYVKLKRELDYLEARFDENTQRRNKQKWKKLTRMAKERANWKRR
jgi:ribosome biogenesis GTPase